MTAPLNAQFTPFPTLETERLVLRCYRESDAPEVFFMRSDPDMLRYIFRPPAQSIDDALVHIRSVLQAQAQNDSLLWVICLKGEERGIGNVCLWNMDKPNYRTEIGYVILPEHQGKGIIHEAATAALDYAFRVIGFHCVTANINPENDASIRVAERLGFVREAYFREHYYRNGKFLDAAVYSLLTPYK
jgi:[ribosomal protein S5]-alanine N-acetyltransferase